MNFKLLWEDYDSSLEKVIICSLIGAVIALLMACYHKRAVGGFVRTLLKRGCADESSALTLAELGYGKAVYLFSALKNPDSGLRRTVSVAEKEGVITSAELKQLRFYVSEDDRYRAEVRYDGKNSNLFVVIVSAALLALAAYLCIKYVPELLALFK